MGYGDEVEFPFLYLVQSLYMATNTDGEVPKEDPKQEPAEEVKTESQSMNPENRPWVKKDMTGRFIDRKPKFNQFKVVKKIINRKNP